MRPASVLGAYSFDRVGKGGMAFGLFVLFGLGALVLSTSNAGSMKQADLAQRDSGTGSSAEEFHELDLESYSAAFLASQGGENRAPRIARNLELIGSYDGRADGGGLMLGAYKKLAFVSGARGSVSIVDISDPRNPRKVGVTPEKPFGTETANAVRIGSRDILAISYTRGIGTSRVFVPTAPLLLFDITDPATPKEVGAFDMGPGFIGDGVFSGSFTFEIVRLRGNRTVALLTPTGSEFYGYLRTTGARFPDGSLVSGLPVPASLEGRCKNLCGDLLIVDISIPENPTLIGEWGILDEPALREPGETLSFSFFNREQRGGRADHNIEYATASEDGRLAYVVYSDYGVFTLDISDPTKPRYLGRRLGFEGDEEGNTRWLVAARGSNLLLRPHLVNFPFQVKVSSPNGVFQGTRTAGIALTSPPTIYNLPGQTMTGEVVFVGLGSRGCDCADFLDGAGNSNVAGKIALMTTTVRQRCNLALKSYLAYLSGAKAIIYFATGDLVRFDSQFPPGAAGRVTLPPGLSAGLTCQGVAVSPGSTVEVPIPAIGVGQNTGLCLAQAQINTPAWGPLPRDCFQGASVQVSMEEIFTGYGALQVFDNTDPDRPIKLSTFTTPNTMDVDAALAARYPNLVQFFTTTKLSVVGSTAYTSWRNDGLRLVDFSLPGNPREIGAWNDPVEGAPAVSAWTVIPSDGVILLSSVGYGLYILKHVP